MRTLLLTLLLALALLPRLLLAAPVQPVTMTAFLDKTVYQTGQPIVLEVDLKNTGTQEAVVGMTADQESQFHFLITEASGRVVPRTAIGDLCFTPLERVAANAPVKIQSGATRRCRFNLTDLYGLLRTGHYTLTVSRTLGDRINVPAPTLTTHLLKFQIRSATAPQNAPVMPFTHDPLADENIP